jgi:hypothetical protein
MVEQLRDKVEQATEEAVLVARIAQAATTTWRAAAWLLVHRYPERWAVGRSRVVDEVERPPAPGVWGELDEIAKKRAKKLGR